jgi:hypothetical protein
MMSFLAVQKQRDLQWDLLASVLLTARTIALWVDHMISHLLS